MFSDGGEFTPNDSIEFQTFTPIGEDIIFFDETANIWYNREIAPSKAPSIFNYSQELRPIKKNNLQGVIGVTALIEELNINIMESTKSLFYEKDGKLILVVVRSDYNVNEVKLRKVAGTGWQPASIELIKTTTGSDVGYA